MVGITLLGSALRFAYLGSKSFWFDECFTYTVTLAPLRDSLSALLVAGIYSPLYFLMLRPVVALAGASEYALRFPSAAFGLLAVPAIYRLGRHLAGASGGVTAALLMAVCPFHIWYSQDARMYAPMVFFGILAMERFVLLLRGQRGWITFAVVSGLAYMLHYAAFSLLYVQLLHLLPQLKRRQLIRRWCLAQGAAIAPLLPWFVLYPMRGIRPAGLGWIPRPSVLAPLATLWNFTTADTETITPAVIALMLGTALTITRGLLPWNRERRLLVEWLALPVAFLFALSLQRPYYVDRYLMASLPAYLLLLASGIAFHGRRLGRILSMTVVLAAMAWGTLRLYTDPAFAKEDWRGATAVVEAGLDEGDVVLLEDQETLIGTSVYRTRQWPYVVLDPSGIDAALEAAEHPRRVWLVWRSPRESNHRLSKSEPFDGFAEATPPVREWLDAHRMQVALDARLAGLCVIRVDLAESK